MEKISKSDELCDKYRKYNEDYQKKKEEEGDFSHLSPFEDDNEEFVKYREELHQLHFNVSSVINELYYQSIEDNFYFHDCPFDVYKNNYLKRFNDFKTYNIDAEEIDFLKKEIYSLIDPSLYDREIFPYFYSEFMPNDLCFEISNNKKIEYIKDKIHSVGWDFEQLPDEEVMVRYDEYEMQPGGFKFTQRHNSVNLKTDLSNEDIDPVTSKYIDSVNFEFEENKSLEHNLSKLTYFAIFEYDNGLQRIYLPKINEIDFLSDTTELKAVIIENILTKINKFNPLEKEVFANRLLSTLTWRVESLENQIRMVRENLELADNTVLGNLGIFLRQNKDVVEVLKAFVVLEDEPNENLQISGEINNTPTNMKLPLQNDISVDPIFLNTKSYKLFLSLIEHLSISTSNISKKGNQAKFHSIWEVSECKKTIFKALIPLEDYTSYLNKTYKTEYKSRSFSDGSKYHSEIKKILNS